MEGDAPLEHGKSLRVRVVSMLSKRVDRFSHVTQVGEDRLRYEDEDDGGESPSVGGRNDLARVKGIPSSLRFQPSGPSLLRLDGVSPSRDPFFGRSTRSCDWASKVDSPVFWLPRCGSCALCVACSVMGCAEDGSRVLRESSRHRE